MAIPWLTVLQAVPWGKVIENAPKVAESAKKLWGRAGRKPGALDVSTGKAGSTSEAARIAALEAAVTELQAQMLASSEVIKLLAEQNTELIRRAEINRRRLLGLAVLVVLMLLATTALLLG